MAIANVQGTGLQSTGSVASLAKAYTSNVTVGNLLTVDIIGNKASTPPTFTGTPPSGNSNTFAQAVTNPSPSNTSRADIWYAKNCNGGATTITVTPNASSFVSIVIHESSGADTTAPRGNTGTGGATGTAAATGAVTIATAGEMLEGVVSHEGAATTITPGGSFNQIFEDEDVTEMPINGEYQFVSANTAASWTIGASRPWLAAAAAFKAATATAASQPTQTTIPPALLTM